MNHYDRGMSAFDGLFVPAELRAAVSSRAWLEAMLDAERALANAGATAGAVPADVASEIAAACAADRFDFEQLLEEGRAVGNPVEPLVRALAGSVGAEAERYVHRGATSQDIADTAAMLVARTALGLVLREADRVAAATAALARDHRETPMVARTVMQHAVPTTFGLKAAGWLTAVVEARRQLEQISRERLAAQLGGAAGTLAGFGDGGVALLELYARELDLHVPTLPWHTNRTRVAELGAGLATLAGVASKIALDLVLLSQPEVAEVAEGGGTGRSSTMPQKRNPVGSMLARANARLAAAHAGVLLGSLEQEHERAAGAWQAEWEALTGALAHTGGALHALAGALESLEVDSARMRQNLDLTGGLVLAERIALLLTKRLGRAEAQEVVREAAGADGGFREALLADSRAGLEPAELDAALDPVTYLGSAPELVDRALALYESARLTLHHRLDGSTDDAPPLLLSNSLGTTLEMWDPQVPALASQFRLVRYDRRGHGRSPVRAGPVFDRGSGLATSSPCSTTSSIERTSFCGLSIGGMVGMWLASQAPERVDRLVLCCTAPILPPREQWLERAATVRAHGVATIADATLDRWFTPRGHRTPGEVPGHARRRRRPRATRAAARRSPTSTCATGWLRSKLRPSSSPAQTIRSRRPKRERHSRRRSPARATSRSTEHAHIANAEQPSAFTEHVLAHLTKETR